MRFPGVLLALLVPLSTGLAVRAQTWALDSNVAPVLANDVSLLLSASWVPTPSGQFLVYGDFTHVSGTPAAGFARIGADGKLDPTFAADLATNERVTAVAPLTDGRAMALISTTNVGVAVPMPPGVATPVATVTDGMVSAPAVVIGGGGIVVAPTTVTTRLIRIGTSGRKDASYTPIDIKGYGQLTALSDGAVIMWGNFVAATSPARNSLLRLKPDGTVDTTFNKGLGSPNNTTAGINIAALAPAPNGAFVYSYTSWFFGDMPAGGGVGYHLERVQPSGAVDSQFGPRVSTVYSMLAVQPDGGVLAASPAISIGIATPGSIASTVDGSSSTGSAISTLPTSGTVQPVTPPTTVIPPLTVPPTIVPPIPAPLFVTRYTATGALDATYNPTITAAKSVTRMAALPGGRVAVEANVGPSTYGAPAVFVLTSTGQIERDFRQLPGASEGQRLLATLSDGRVLVAQGTLVLNSTYYYPVPYDTTMPATTTAIMPIFFGPVLANPTLGISPPDASAGATTPLVTLTTTIVHRYAGFVSRLESDSASRVLAAGQFTQVANQPRSGLARFLADGGLDLSYNPAAGSLVFAPSDGRVIVSRSSIGPVNASDGYHRYLTDVVRLQTDGAVDGTFAFPSSLTASATNWLAAASDGRLLISAFDPDESREQNLKLIWLGSDGRRLTTLSTVFTGFTRNIIMPLAATTTVTDAATAAASATTSVTVTTVSGAVGISLPTDSVAAAVTQTAVASASGATAATTGPASVVIAQPALPFGRPNVIDAVQILSNGQLLVAGAFSQVNGVARPGLARLQADGSLDAAYAPNLSALTYRYSALLLPDGRAIVFGSTVTLGRWQSATVRLRADGAVDSSFTPPPNTLGSDARLLADGSLFSGGRRYTADGWPDLNFGPQLGLSGNSIGYGTTAVRVGASGPLWLGGNFDQVNGQMRSGIARFTPGETIGITVQPKSQSAVAGREAIFQVGIGTLQPATYRWTHDGVTVAGATNAYLRVPAAAAADGGVYRATVTIGAQSFTSDAATLTVLPNRSRLVNFSARSFVSASSAPQIAGIVCNGEPRQVLLRAVGLGMPVTLGAGSAGLAMPVLTLYDGGSAIASDRGGATSTAVTALAAKVGAFPINTSFNAPVVNAVYGSALTPALGGGAFTASTSSGNGTSGVSLFECYDTGDESSAPLIRNFAIRGQTSPGANVLIGGFVIAGNGPRRVLVRGLGPALAGFGVDNAIASPHLELFAGGASAAVVVNDGWNGDVAIADAARSAGAFPLAANSRDAAVVLVLEPGAYTAQVTSSTGGTGTAMIEIYALDDN